MLAVFRIFLRFPKLNIYLPLNSIRYIRALKMWMCPVCGATEFVMTPNGGKVHKIRCTACESTFELEEAIQVGSYSRNW